MPSIPPDREPSAAGVSPTNRSVSLRDVVAPKFFGFAYTTDHWSMVPCRLEDPKMVAIARFQSLHYAIFMNPIDSRGYRCIVRMFDNDDMPSTFNRVYSPQEHLGLALMTELADRAMRRITPIVQTFKLGNNAHGFDMSSHTTLIGNSHEPSILHSHVLGRGDPEFQYIPGIRLGGPRPGTIFDIGGKGECTEGQEIVPWSDGDIVLAAQALKSSMSEIIEPVIPGLVVRT